MANLTELPQWDAGVYRLETTDPAEGGEAGKANAPLKNLANRTVYLKQHVDALESQTSMSAHLSASDPHPVYMTSAEVAALIASSGGLGVGQTWNEVTGSRNNSTVYQNTTGKPILLDIFVHVVTLNVHILVGASSNPTQKVSEMTPGYAVRDDSLSCVVPAGWYYKCPADTIYRWSELR